MTALLDRYDFNINGVSYTVNVSEAFDITRTPDTLSRTASLSAYEVEQFIEQGADLRAGLRVEIEARREGLLGFVENIFVGTIVDKFVVEEGGADSIDLNMVDDLYRLSRSYAKVSVASQTITKDLFLFFKDDGSGSGAPGQYTRKAELREFNGSYFIPWEDMDTIPPHSLRRKKDDEPSVYLTFNQYKMQYRKKELVFEAAQVDNTLTPPALPIDYVAGTPDPPSLTNQGWTYKMVASFFKNPDYPTRNINAQTVENVLRALFAADPLTDAGGAGFPAAQLALTFAYAKGAATTIPDRANEGMRVTLVSGSDVTVSDGSAWAGKVSLDYFDAQGLPHTATISSILGDVLTLSAPPTNLIAGSRVYGCDQLGRIVTLTGVGESTIDLANYTDVVINDVTYHIREIRDATTLVLVNTTETDDFSAMPASGPLTYPTIEYTGIQVNRLLWDKEQGNLAEFVQHLHDTDLLPLNYRLDHIPHIDVIRGRVEKQWQATTIGAPAGLVVTVDNVDGFYPGHSILWYDTTDSTYRVSTITSVDYSAETLTLADVTHIVNGTVLYGDGKIIYRFEGGEHGVSLDNMFYRTEIVSTANQSFPTLNDGLTSDLNPPPSNVGLPAGSWSVVTGGADEMVDDTPTTMYLLRWIATAANQLEGDPEQYNMIPVPWPVCSWDTGALDDFDQVLLQIGYTKEEKVNTSIDGYTELPMFSVECSSEDVALASVTQWTAMCSELVAHQFDPMQPNSGQLTFKCDLIRRFRHVRILCDRPFFYKLKENVFGTPTRCRDVPILSFQLYKLPKIVYTEQDDLESDEMGAPDGQITPYLGQKPFCQLTNQGGDISNIAALVLTVGADHNFEDGDTVEFYDVSADEPFTGTALVTAHAATTITVDVIPVGVVVGDQVGGHRRWLMDVAGNWRDMLAKETIAGLFANVIPCQMIEDEAAQNGWDAQEIAVTRQWDSMLSVRDGRCHCLYDPTIRLYDQVIASGIFAPEKVMGLVFSGFQQSMQLRQYNVTIEQMSEGA